MLKELQSEVKGEESMKGLQSPDIRLGLIGLNGSGKTHFVATLEDVYWNYRDETSLSFKDRDTLDLFHENRRTLLGGEFIPQTPMERSDLYVFEFTRNSTLGLGGFEYVLEVLDVSGERFSEGDETIYSQWLIQCNALMVIIDGELLQEGLESQEEAIREQLLLLRQTLNLIEYYLAPVHKKKKQKVFVAICVSKFDLFETVNIAVPEELVQNKFASLYHDLRNLEKKQKNWMTIKWYGFSSIGFVWDDRGTHYVDAAGDRVEEGNRLSQCVIENGEAKLRKPQILRPEGVAGILEDIQRNVDNRFGLSQMSRDEIVRHGTEDDSMNKITRMSERGVGRTSQLPEYDDDDNVWD